MIFIGFIIGFLGYLPPGNINLTVIQMSIGRHRSHLLYFILFASLMEFVYCFGSLMGMKFLLTEPKFILVIRWSSILVFTILGIISFLHRVKEPEHRSSGIRRGMLIALLNPLQVPFWLIWGVYVLHNGWVKPTLISITLFSIITAAGALTILWLYAVAGRKMETILNAHQLLLHRVIGCIFIGLAVLELLKLLK